MTDAHTHIGGETAMLLNGIVVKRFAGVHPWDAEDANLASALAAVEVRVAEDPECGVGEIGLDRLKCKTIPDAQRQAFLAQLEIAAKFARPVVLHGAKCWGEVVHAAQPFAGRIPAFLFHGFSRSAGLLADIRRMNGFVSVGAAVLNDHAVNYRSLVAAIPSDMLLIETDGKDYAIEAVAEKVAQLRGVLTTELESLTDANAARFIRQ